MKEGESGLAAVLSASEPTSGISVVDSTSQKEGLDIKLQQAQAQLSSLRRQQEDLERQKNELEDLRRRQEEYLRGKADMIDRLNSGLVLLEREHLQSLRTADLCAVTRQSFRDYLDQIDAIHDEQWTNTNLRAELSRALGVIENARLEHNRATAAIACMNSAVADNATAPRTEASSALCEGEFLRYVKIGIAVSLPLIIAGTVWLIVFLLAKH